jgi:hypothetical protein
MATTNVHPEPNRADPLSEPTRARRLWAAHLAAGLTGADVARALKLRYQTVWKWYHMGTVPGLEQFQAACELTSYTCQEILYGRQVRPDARRPLDRDGVRRLFVELATPPAVRAAFARWQESPDGRYEDVDRECVVAWLDAYAAASRADQETARERAVQAAMQARALSAAVNAGARAIDTSALAGDVQRKRKVTRLQPRAARGSR